MIVLDTNVVSELIHPHPAAPVVDWFYRQAALRLYLSSITEAELRYGVEVLPEGSRRMKLRAAVEGLLREDFAGRILPFESDAARAYALIAASRRATGRPISRADCQIAAIARSVGASVATRDTGGFEGCGVGVVNPWSD
ncbi:MAG: type II toxin-antitoxin system VapC family toxin [bacterium]|nr:type II toxin-antitoxin system VapC family toxin [bacterium]